MKHLRIKINKYEVEWNVILKDIDFILNENDKIALVWWNWVWKTTLMKIITWEIKDYDGFIENIWNLKVWYLTQIYTDDKEKLVRQEIKEWFFDIIRVEKELQELEELMNSSPPARGESRWIEFTQEIVPWGIEGGFDFIFFIASFHHLDSLEKRERLMSNLKNILNKNWIVFMTNWALKSEVNFEKYKDDEIKNSQNQFWSLDFNIKFWEYLRYYHCFSLEELEYLIKKPWFQIIENRLFDSKKNFISTFGL